MNNISDSLPSNLAARKDHLVRYPIHVRMEHFNENYISYTHFHDFPQIWYCTGGHYIHHTQSGNHPCSEGSLVIIPPGRPDGFTVPTGTSAHFVCLEITHVFFLHCDFTLIPHTLRSLFLPVFADQTTCQDCFQLSDNSSHKAAELFHQLLQAIPDSADHYAVLSQLLEHLFSLPELHYPETYRESQEALVTYRIIPMLRALAYINNHYSEKIHLEELTKLTAMCQTNFMNHFKHFTGMSFSKYMQLLRNSHARRLISFSDYSLSHIADLCGYNDTAYMINCFKKLRGRTPKAEKPDKGP